MIGDYQYIIPKVSKQAEKSKAAYDETMRKIRAFKDGGGKEEVQRLEAETARLRDSIIRMNQTDSYIQVQLTGIDHLFFSTLEWAQHLDFVTEKAAENHIVITTQENKVQGSQVGFGPVMEVVVDGEGSFQSAMKYLFIVETGVSITPIEELEMKIDEKDRLAFKAKSVLWGMK
ncbi:MAG: hypothetical protein LBU73_10220 [Helicobacteraceae bacterium]|nr:hypothetical protein [Helicobacteraceae bacterium]